MSLSDACWDFEQSTQSRKCAVEELYRASKWYGQDDYPIKYGARTIMLMEACQAYLMQSTEKNWQVLMLMAETIRTDLDTPPPPQE